MVVMKYGGTSVRDPDAVRRLVAQVQATRTAAGEAPAGPVVVVSALAKVTDALLELARHAVEGNTEAAGVTVGELQRRHASMADALVVESLRRREALAAVHRELRDLDAIVRALAVLGEASPRSHDILAAVGELVSSRLVAAALEDAGVPATWIDPRQVIVTNDEHMSAQPLMADTCARLEDVVRPVLQAGRVPVVGGFVGASRQGATTTLGRGGSDYSASIIGAALGADEIQIWTDVDGMLTADPRLVPGGRVVPELSFDEASELAYFGAKVLHPSTILPAMRRGIPVRILNATYPDRPGTRISERLADGRRDLAAIACKRGVTMIDITSTRMLMAWGFLGRLFGVFEKYRTSVDVVTTSEVAVSVTIDDHRRLADIVADVSQFAQVEVEERMAILCAVGERLRSDPALGTRVLGALEGLPIEMVSQGGSRKNITVVLPDSCAVAAMTRLHDRFFSDALAEATS
jgi:aspartate kinase